MLYPAELRGQRQCIWGLYSRVLVSEVGDPPAFVSDILGALLRVSRLSKADIWPRTSVRSLHCLTPRRAVAGVFTVLFFYT